MAYTHITNKCMCCIEKVWHAFNKYINECFYYVYKFRFNSEHLNLSTSYYQRRIYKKGNEKKAI